MYTSASLFTGGGGADIGLEMAGFKTVWGIERDEKIAEYAQLNLPHANIINSCVSEVKPHRLKYVDLLWMSPPCQEYSNARRGDLAEHKDKDAGLYCESFIAGIDPRWVILENVPGYAKSPVFEAILRRLTHHGYRYHYQILNAADYGVPQDRKRLIMWAVRRGERLPFFPMPQRRVGWYEAIAHLIPSLPDTKLADWQIKRLEAALGSNKLHYPILIPRAGANINNCLPSLPNEPCSTIRAFAEGRHTHWADVVYLSGLSCSSLVIRQSDKPSPAITTKALQERIIGEGFIKQLTPEATAILQSFPGYYILPQVKTLAQKIIGNAVPPLLAKALGEAILKSIKP